MKKAYQNCPDPLTPQLAQTTLHQNSSSYCEHKMPAVKKVILLGLHTLVAIETAEMAEAGCLTFKLSAIKLNRQKSMLQGLF